MFAILFINENEGWAGSGSGIVLHTTNGGDNWAIDAEATEISTGKFISKIFYIPSRQTIYVLGNHGLLLKKSSVNGITARGKDEIISFKVYPNPCRKIMNIKFNDNRSGPQHITIINMMGIKVRELTLTGSKLQLDISDLPAGTYMVFADSRENLYSGKLIVMK
jgi:hypothetical protein